MKVTQISDLHIGLIGQDTNQVDVRHNFLMLLGEVKVYEPDLIVITGDLCFNDGSLEIYSWIKERMEKLEIPYLIIPGNHDDVAMIKEVFKIEYTQNEEELFFARKINKQTLLFLDSSKATMSGEQLNWLKRQFKQTDERAFVFTHYPPCEMGVDFMDHKYPFRDSSDLMEILLNCDKQVFLFCGHYHNERMILTKNLSVYLCPSLIMQIAPNGIEYQVEHHRIGFRNIEFKQDVFKTFVKYLEGKKI